MRNTGLFGYMQPWHCTADKGYVGLGCDTPFKRRPGKPLLDWQKRFNKGINQIRYVRKIHSPSESMADPFYPL
ncbi:hypothetical protein [Corynebacterium matruchotii]|uniref:hypothetical protein n=1 Tax=Corynebacterium matruchotii TaxID=43768 RepID=UPI0028F0AC88|nr:hypothetical protein [Corynebacterium matruchotii]